MTIKNRWEIPSTSLDNMYTVMTNVVTIQYVITYTVNSPITYVIYYCLLIILSTLCKKGIREATLNFVLSLGSMSIFRDNEIKLIISAIVIEIFRIVINLLLGSYDSLILRDGEKFELPYPLILVPCLTFGVLLFLLYYHVSCPEAFTRIDKFHEVFLLSARNLFSLIGQRSNLSMDNLHFVGFIFFTYTFWLSIGFSSTVATIIQNFRNVGAKQICVSFLILPVTAFAALVSAYFSFVVAGIFSLIIAIPTVIISVVVSIVFKGNDIAIFLNIIMLLIVILIQIGPWFLGGWSVVALSLEGTLDS